MLECSTLDIEGATLREMTVWQATRMGELSERSMADAVDYFLGVLPSLVTKGKVDIVLLRSKPIQCIELFNKYREWLYNPLTEEEIHQLAQDCKGLFEGRTKRVRSPYREYVTNLFLPILDTEKGILAREVFPGSRAEQPYRTDLILRIISSIYSEWANKKRKEAMKKK